MTIKDPIGHKEAEKAAVLAAVTGAATEEVGGSVTSMCPPVFATTAGCLAVLLAACGKPTMPRSRTNIHSLANTYSIKCTNAYSIKYTNAYSIKCTNTDSIKCTNACNIKYLIPFAGLDGAL